MREKIIIEDITEFSISQIAESGQAFRWDEDGEGIYTGVAYGKVISVSNDSDQLTIIGSNQNDYEEVWEIYFDLNRDYKAVIDSLMGKDNNLDSAIAYGNGIRILNQDLWEMIISFIISGNNNIPRIKKSIEVISERYGEFITEINGKRYFSFPSPKQLSVATVEELRECGVGYRDSYIFKTTKAIIENKVELASIKTMNLDDARKELKKLTGVGDKVADCILLFAGGKTNAFPVDTWVKKILTDYYGFEKSKLTEVNKFANEYFGEYCGIAQQYLFYYIRSLND